MFVGSPMTRLYTVRDNCIQNREMKISLQNPSYFRDAFPHNFIEHSGSILFKK